MRTNKILNKVLTVGAFCTGLWVTSSCEDFLTVLPTNSIVEEDFWTSSTDLDNVRAAAYRQMADAGITSRILYWGELRSDNFTQNDMTQTDISYVQQGILMPTNSMYNWASLYKGINICNLVLEQGDLMTETGNEVDPTFRRSDWLPMKAEMLAMRALYYFYLVRAYRDVPYVTTAVRTDEEARARTDGQTPGVNILGYLIEQLEECESYAADNYGNDDENTGRITQRGVQAILADMYLWRGCMLENNSVKGDVVVNSSGDTLTTSEITALKDSCYEKAIEYSDAILDYFQEEYDEDLADGTITQTKTLVFGFPYLTRLSNRGYTNITDDICTELWGESNSSEAIFQLKYDGTDLLNSTPYSYFSASTSSLTTAGYVVGASILYSSATGSNYNPTSGYGVTDIRLLETMYYDATSSPRSRIHKNIASGVTIANLQDVSEGLSGTTTRSYSSSQSWPIYRLTDIMLIKAEALARSVSSSTTASSGNAVDEGYTLVNAIFERSNPALSATSSLGASEEYASDRLRTDYATGNSLTAADLLELVYHERQREFVGEGKRWFDIVRQCEAGYSDGTNETVLSTFISLSSSVQNRLRRLYGVYSPIYSEEININGVENGGNLTQNPVWARYSSN